MITEDYVSFEVAKLLKEKGFDEQCTFMYDSQHKLYSVLEQCRQYYRNNSDWIHYVGKLNICPIAAPTLQMIMKWIREIHHYHIMIDCLGSKNYLPTIQQTNSSKDYKVEGSESRIMGNGFDSYEEAVEAAIKYCLMNLI